MISIGCDNLSMSSNEHQIRLSNSVTPPPDPQTNVPKKHPSKKQNTTRNTKPTSSTTFALVPSMYKQQKMKSNLLNMSSR